MEQKAEHQSEEQHDREPVQEKRSYEPPKIEAVRLSSDAAESLT